MHAELTHIPVSPRTRNILLAIVAGLILLIFWKAPTLPKLLLTGMAVALVLSFPVKYLSKIIPRGIAIAIVVLTLLAILVVGGIVLVPLAVAQLASLAEQAPRLLDEAYGWARRVVENLAARGLLDTTPDEAMVDLQRTGAQRVNGLLGDVVARAFDTLSGTVGGVFTTLSVILIAAYLLADGERFRQGTIRLLPVQYRDDALVLFSDVVEALSRNFTDGNLIAPRVQGNAIRVSPLFIFLAVIAGGQIAGIWGALMAVPALAVVRVVFDFLMDRVVVVPQTLDPLPVAIVEPPSDATTTSLKALNTSGAAAARVATPRS
jgi:predicted PurR-regulated permease PerM